MAKRRRPSAAETGKARAAEQRAESSDVITLDRALVNALATDRTVYARLRDLQRDSDRSGRHAEAAAISAIMVAVCDVLHKASLARGLVGPAVADVIDELEALR